MRRAALLLLSAAAALAAPASASAAVTPTRDAVAVAAALSTPAVAAVTGLASFEAAAATIPPNGNPAATSDGLLGGFPTDGSSFAVLSSGDATQRRSCERAGGGRQRQPARPPEPAAEGL